MPCRLTLGEVAVNGGSGVMTVSFRREPNCTRQKLCRVPDKWHSAKLALPVLFMASGIRRVLHSANNLPSVLCLLSSVSGTRQTQGVRYRSLKKSQLFAYKIGWIQTLYQNHKSQRDIHL